MTEITLKYLTGESNYTWLHYSNGEKKLTTQTLKKYQETYPHFIRIHKKALVDPAYIEVIKSRPKSPDKIAVLIDGQELTISRRRWPDFEKLLEEKLIKEKSTKG
jgi:DNA-binding LytR/AlgR family response regulator